MAKEYEEVEAAIQARQAQIRAHRLGTVLQVGDEILKSEEGVGLNHWSAWADAEVTITAVPDESPVEIETKLTDEETTEEVENALTASAAEQVTAITNSAVKTEEVHEREQIVPEAPKDEPKKPIKKAAAKPAPAKDAEGS